jgi:hypothetical protein
MFEIFMIIGGALMRLLPHAPNFAPIAAIALFGGAYLNKKYALILPLAAMFLSDIFLGFHDTMGYVYGAFLLTGMIGLWLRKHKNVVNVFGATLASSVLFFLISNFGVWAQGMYARDISGLFQSYVMAIPFFKNTLVSNFFYTGLMFGSYELVKALIAKKSFVTSKAK